MSEVSAQDVQNLRRLTGAGMMDCKKALMENGGDRDAAVDWLRKKGIAKAAAKSDRIAHEGLVALAHKGTTGALVSLRSETDFVARNEIFQACIKDLGTAALTLKEGATTADLEGMEWEGKVVSARISELAGSIGENISLGEVAVMQGASCLGTYIHNAVDEGLGRIGVLVSLEGKADDALAKQLAMHIAAMNPLAIDAQSLPAQLVAREKDVLAERARTSGKDDAIVEKMIEGGLKKWHKEVTLLEQKFIMDDSMSVGVLLKNAGCMVKDFHRLAVGAS